MMKKFIFSLIAVMLCTQGAPAASTGTDSENATASDNNYIAISKVGTFSVGDVLTVERFTLKSQQVDYKISYPVAGNRQLVKALQDSIRNVLDKNYHGLMASPEQLFESAARTLSSEPELTTGLNVEIIKSTPKSVTILFSGWDYYEGAAHGMHYETGETYRTSDALKLTIGMMPSINVMRPYLIEALAAYFQTSVADIDDCLFNSSSTLEYPANGVYIENGALVFMYSEYEIAAYAYGLPKAVIKLTPQIKNLLSPMVLSFF